MRSIQFKRATAARWAELNPILDRGEPGFVYDLFKFKIGDGKTPWNELQYIGSDQICCADSIKDLPEVGAPTVLYKVANERQLYQWNTTSQKYEPLAGSSGGGGTFDPSIIKIINGGNANG